MSIAAKISSMQGGINLYQTVDFSMPTKAKPPPALLSSSRQSTACSN